MFCCGVCTKTGSMDITKVEGIVVSEVVKPPPQDTDPPKMVRTKRPDSENENVSTGNGPNSMQNNSKVTNGTPVTEMKGILKKPTEGVVPNGDKSDRARNHLPKSHAPRIPDSLTKTDSSSVKKENLPAMQNLTLTDHLDDKEYEEEVEEEEIDAVDHKRREGQRGQWIDFDNEIVKHPKTKPDEDLIRKAIRSNNFLQNFVQQEHITQSIVDAMYSKDVHMNEFIIEQGTIGSEIFVSAKGTFEILIDNKSHDIFQDHRVFGELAVLYKNPRLATIRARSAGKVWVLDGAVFQQIVVQNAIQEEQEKLNFLKKVPAMSGAPEDKLLKIVNLFNQQFFKTDMEIIREGDTGDNFYIVKAGTVTISKKGEGKVASLGKGQYFGERALYQEERRKATVIADSPGVECLVLSRIEFTKYLGEFIEFLKGQVEKPVSDVTVDNKFSHIELKHLKIEKTLGVGGFGRVELVLNKNNTSQAFALKYLIKHQMIEKNQKEHAFNEKKIQMSCNSEFIVRLYKTYQDQQYLYYLLECCLGGDLWSLLQKQKGRCFDEPKAKFLAGCVLEAIAYLHDRDYVYRDLKPENLLIDRQGYVKLTDFGFAKHLSGSKKTYTFAGTPEYVAREIVLNQGHDKSVDYWAFGIFIFELLVGKTPFATNDPTHMKTYNAILKGIDNVMMPPRVQRAAQLIIKKLCKSVPTERLGYQKNGIDDIRNHRWFSDFKWQALRARQLKPPFVPTLKSNTDTRYFDNFEPDRQIAQSKGLWEGF